MRIHFNCKYLILFLLSFLAFSCGRNEPSSGGNNNNGSNNENNSGNNGNNNNENQGNSDPEGDPDPAPASISLSSNSFNLDSDGGYLEVTITSSEDWTLSGSSNWCYPSQTYGKSGDIVCHHLYGIFRCGGHKFLHCATREIFLS